MTAMREFPPERILRSFGLRCTPGRLALLKILAEANHALSQEQIAALLKQTKQSLNKVSIYRALECFVETGMVHRAFLQNRIWHYELSFRCSVKQCHPHFHCYICRCTFCMPQVSVPLASGLEEGFILERQQVRLEGICPNCKDAKAK